MAFINKLLGNNNLPSYSAMSDKQETLGKDRANRRPLKEAFTSVSTFYDDPHPWFDDPNYYKKVLAHGGDAANKMHHNLATFLKTKDPADKAVYKGRLITAFWEVYKEIMTHVSDDNFDMCKKLFLRYGALLPNLISPEHRKMLSSIFIDNHLDEAVWYADEWVKMVAEGEVNALATDEVHIKKSAGNEAVAKLRTQLEKITGAHEALGLFLHDLNSRRAVAIEQLTYLTIAVSRAEPCSLLVGTLVPFSIEQRDQMVEITDTLKTLNTLAKEIANSYEKYNEEEARIQSLTNEIKVADSKGLIIDTALITQESEQIQALTKMCVGRKGNHFPLLASQYFSSDIKFIATRENIVAVLAEIESIDPQIFQREFRRQVNRIPPHVIIVPCYGSSGSCWEPYERANKATSRGRIAIPLFPSDLKTAVITALGMFRWEVAKEMSAHYWMEEGLTGQFYQWFSNEKMRGNVRDAFVENYLLWINMESKGIQKLEREVRGIFWRTMPFTEERRNNLKLRGFVYDDLYKKDLNRADSLGY